MNQPILCPFSKFYCHFTSWLSSLCLSSPSPKNPTPSLFAWVICYLIFFVTRLCVCVNLFRVFFLQFFFLIFEFFTPSVVIFACVLPSLLLIFWQTAMLFSLDHSHKHKKHTDKQRIWRHLVEPLLLFCFCFWFFSAFVWITYVCVCGSFLCFVVWFWLGHWTACSLPKNKKLQSQFERRREFFAGIRPIAVEIGWNRALRGFEGEVFAQK